ncbi:MAG: hypothetical protein EOO50_11545 [Flavobacterium sp.]|uniref:hypothetical protein n=1 Tax=Flavobacterium sp. TaxID=239 RepID=UPI0012279718|nr:hypothetical protein [Flavobacterium sp.]RZJ66038.1 MAG: hypothetical protein EOO50_11545 [Flavobacterium sp.]
MTKIIFRFTMAVTSAIGSYTSGVNIDIPKMPRPEIRVEKIKNIEVEPIRLVENKKTALS